MKYIVLIILCMPLVSCNCHRYTNGYVADYETKEVLEGVEVYSVAASDGRSRDHRVTQTDGKGFYEAVFDVSGIAKCPVMKITFSKAGYNTDRVVEPLQGDTVFLHRIQ